MSVFSPYPEPVLIALGKDEMKRTQFGAALLLSTVLAACGGGSSSDDASADTYLQLYNGAASAGNTQLKAGETTIGSAAFGDVTSVVALKTDSYELIFTDVSTAEELVSEQKQLTKDDKMLLILTEQDQQFDYLSVSFKRDVELEDKFNLYLANLSTQYPNLDVYLAAENKPFADAVLQDSLSLHEVSSQAKTNATGKYNVYLTRAGQTTPVFTAESVNFAYENTYVLIVRDKHGPLEQQISVDVVLNSSSVSAFSNKDASAQFRLYNSLSERVHLALDNQLVGTVNAGEMSDYIASGKGDYSLSVRDGSGNLLLNSALLSLTAGDSKQVLLYNTADTSTEALAVTEKDTPQLTAHDVLVANLVTDFEALSIYFVRQHETISNAKYSVKNLAFKRQQSINLPQDYYAIALVHVAENGSTTLLDKTDSMMLTPERYYSLLAEKDDAAPSGYKLKLVY